MRKLLAAVFLFTAAHLFAVTPVPYTEAVSFSLRIQGGGGNALMTIYDESGSPTVGATLGSPPSTAVESDMQVSWLRPGKQYSVNFSGSGPTNYWMSFIVPEGYVLYVDGTPTDLVAQVPGGGEYSNDYTIVLLPIPKATQPVPYSQFSGVKLGKSVSWSIGLGYMNNGRPAGEITFKERDLTSSPASRAKLYYTQPDSYGETNAIMDGSSAQQLRQVWVPQGLIDLVDDTNGYWLKFYLWSQVEFSPGNPAILYGSPWKTIRVETPSSNQLKITETEGSVSRVSLVTAGAYTTDYVWTVKEGDGSTWLRSTTNASTNHPTASPKPYRDVIAQTYTGDSDAGGTVVTKTKYHYETEGWGDDAIGQIVADPDTAALTTSYTYYETAPSTGSDEYRGNYRRVMSVTDPTGNWTAYHYYNDWNTRGQLKYEFHPYLDTPASAPSIGTDSAASAAASASANGRVLYYEYTTDWTGRYNRPTLRQEFVNNVRTGQTIWSQGDNTGVGWPREYSYIMSYSDGTNYRTDYSERYRADAGADDPGRPYMCYAADLTRTIWNAAMTSGSTPQYREIQVHGTLNSSGADSVSSWDTHTFDAIYMVPYKSTMDTTIRDNGGNIVRSETWIYTGSGVFSLMTAQVYTYDQAGRLLTQVKDNNTLLTNTYTGGRLTDSVDASGTETQYTYDIIGRVATSVNKGAAASGSYAAQGDITTTYTYDGAGHVKQTVISGGSLSLTATSAYDLAGRMTSSTAPGSYITGYAYSAGGRIVTTTMPDTGTKTTELYPDGQTKSVSGTAAIAENYSYSIDGSGNHVRQAVYGGNYSAYVNSTVDWLGRPIQETKPAWSSGTVSKTSYYNSYGQLYKVSQTGLADTLYTYDTLGVLFRKGLDINANGSLDLSSNDRITEYGWSYYYYGGASWTRRDTTSVYPTSGSSTPIVTSTVDHVLVNPAGRLSGVISTDIYGNSTTTTVDVNPSSKLLVKTTVVPNSTTAAQDSYYNGLLVSSRDQTNLTATYGYDNLGRQTTSTDPRTGTTATAYVSGTSQVYSVTDPASVVQATYTYDSAGRIASVTDALGKVAHFDYNAQGQKLHAWGQTTYPIAYVYDSMGRIYQQSTYASSTSGFTGSSWPSSPGTPQVTTWNYDAATNFLASKVDANGKSVTFTYTAAGQVATRTWARGTVTTYGYSSTTGELLTQTYSDSTPSVTYTYTRLGQFATAADVTGTRTFNYSATTAELTQEDLGSFLGTRSVAYQYDTTGTGTKGRLTLVGFGPTATPTSEYTVGYGYDTYGRMNQVGNFAYNYLANSNLLASISDLSAAWTQSRSYLANRDLLSDVATSWSSAVKADFGYTYDNLGRRTAVTKAGEMFNRYNPTGLTTNWGYDDRSELTSESTVLAGTSTPLNGRSDTYTFDNLGNRSNTTHNGNSATYTLDSNGLNQYVSRDVPGHIDVAGLAPGAATVTVNGSSTGVSRNYDYYFKDYPVTNTSNAVWQSLAIASSLGGSDTRYAYLAKTAESFSYDDDGNLLSDGRWDYVYDAENRLVSMQTHAALSPSPIANSDARRLEFFYDYQGRRVEKIVRAGYNGTSYATTLSDTKALYDGWNLIREFDALNSLATVRSYVWGIDWSGTLQGAGGVGGVLMIQDGSNTFLPAYDGAGNLHALMTVSAATIGGTSYGAGGIVATYEYDAFGQTLRASGGYAATNPIRFSTKYTDLESSLVYFGQRYYSPSLGRFLNRDPIEEQGGLNLYAFCGNNGVNRWDLLGNNPNLATSDPVAYWATLTQAEKDQQAAAALMGADDKDAIVNAYNSWIASSNSDAIANGVSATGASGDFVQASAQIAKENQDTARAWQVVQNTPGAWSGTVIGSSVNKVGVVTPGDPVLVDDKGNAVANTQVNFHNLGPAAQSTATQSNEVYTESAAEAAAFAQWAAVENANYQDTHPSAGAALAAGFRQVSGSLNFGAKAGEAVGIAATAAWVLPGAVAGAVELGVEGVATAKGAGNVFSFRLGLQIAQVTTTYVEQGTFEVEGLELTDAAWAERAAQAAADASRLSTAAVSSPP